MTYPELIATSAPIGTRDALRKVAKQKNTTSTDLLRTWMLEALEECGVRPDPEFFPDTKSIRRLKDKATA